MKRMWSRKELMQIASLMAIAQMQSGDVENVKVFENIVDKDGHQRFIEGNGVIHDSITIENGFGKWSLSGSHLMFVFAGTFKNASTISSYTALATFTLPQWIFDKIQKVWGNNIEVKSASMYGSDWSTQTLNAVLYKSANTIVIQSQNSSTITLTADRGYRIGFDLLIDNE